MDLASQKKCYFRINVALVVSLPVYVTDENLRRKYCRGINTRKDFSQTGNDWKREVFFQLGDKSLPEVKNLMDGQISSLAMQLLLQSVMFKKRFRQQNRLVLSLRPGALDESRYSVRRVFVYQIVLKLSGRCFCCSCSVKTVSRTSRRSRQSAAPTWPSLVCRLKNR